MPTIKVPDNGHPRLDAIQELVNEAIDTARAASEVATEAQQKAWRAAIEVDKAVSALISVRQALGLLTWDGPAKEEPKPNPTKKRRKLTKEEQYALDHLHEGSPAGKQPHRVKCKLRDLEHAGHVWCDVENGHGWRLVTD